MSRLRSLPSLPSLQPSRWPGIQGLVQLPIPAPSRAGRPTGVNGSGTGLREQGGQDRGRAGWSLRRPRLPGPLRGGRLLQRRSARSGRDPDGEEPAPPLPVVRISCSFGPGRAATLPHDVLARVAGSGTRAGTVVLDLAAVRDIAPEDCAALCSLHGDLHRIGIRLTIAVSAQPVLERLRADGVLSLLGAGAVHPSLRAAVLAVYAALPGPGLVTSIVRDALTVPADPLDHPDEPLGRAAEPAGRAAEPAGRAGEPLGQPGEPLGQPARPPSHLPFLAGPAGPGQHPAVALSTARPGPGTASPAPDGVCPNVWLVNCSDLDEP